MKNEDKKQEMDRHLQVPAEANRDKHHNFLADDEESDNNAKPTERQKQWKKGLEQGRAARNED